MGIYGHNFDEFKIEEISIEEAIEATNICNTALVEYYEDLEDSQELFTEGANLEIRKIFKQYKKDVKDLKKKYRSDYKNDKEAAIKDLDEINAMITNTIKEIKKVDADSVASVILGDIYSITLDAVIIATGLKITGLIGGSVGALTKSVDAAQMIGYTGGSIAGYAAGTKVGKQISSLIANFKKFKDGKISAAEYFNLYRGEILQTLEQTRTWNNALKIGIRKEIKNKKEK